MKRTVIIAILAALIPLSLYAQGYSATPKPSVVPPWPITGTYFTPFDNSGNTANNESWDYVTVGSLMPYRVKEPLLEGDVPQNADFRIDYKWLFTLHGSTTPMPVLNMPTEAGHVPNPGAATDAPTMSPATPNWYTTNTVSIKMPLTPTEDDEEITLAHNTRFVFNGIVLCDAITGPPDLTYKIKVVPKPSIKLTATGGATDPDVEIVACVGDDVLFPVTNPGANLTVDGYDDINVQFTLLHRELGSTDDPTAKVTAQWLVLDGKTLEFPGSLFDEPGVYSINILNVTDRISRKSLDQGAVAAVIGTDTPAAGKLKVYIYPQPNTPGVNVNDVQHIRNNVF